MNIVRLVFVLCLNFVGLLHVYGNNSTDSFPKKIPLHPCLLVNSIQIENIKKEIKENSWKIKSWMQLKETADKFLNEKVEIPTRGGNWEHYYVDTVTGNTLIRGNLIGDWRWEHIDTVTHKILYGDTTNIKTDYDGVVISFLHDTWAIGILQLGLAYQLSGDSRYALKAKEIVLAYCDIYPRLPILNKVDNSALLGTGFGKVHRQDLNESIWLIDIMQGCDLIWNTIDNKTKKRIITQLVDPAVAVIMKNKSEISNIQCWRNTAIGLAGFLKGDEVLIKNAIYDTSGGYISQLSRGLTSDGFYCDLSPTYHFYALNAMVQLVQAAQNCNYPIDVKPLKKMFDFPILLADSRFSIPPFNDSRNVNLFGESYLYEWAFSKFEDKEYLAIINRKNRSLFTNIGPTFTGFNLLFGKINLEKPLKRILENYNFPSTGIAILTHQNQSKDHIRCYVTYSDQLTNRRHFHRSQLDFSIFNGKQPVTIVSGVHDYGSAATELWFRQAIAHNSFYVNERGQAPSSGKLLAFGIEKDVEYTTIETSNTYDSARFIRTIAIPTDSLIVVINQFHSSKMKPQLVDIFYHPIGIWKDSISEPKWSPSQRTSKSYNWISNPGISKIKVQSNFGVVFPETGKEVMISTFSDAQVDIIRGYGKAPVGKNIPIIVYRTKGNDIIEVTCISLNGKKIGIEINKPYNVQGRILAQVDPIQIMLSISDIKKINMTINPDRLKTGDKNDYIPKIFLVK